MVTLKIDFVSDIVCPWCVIGFKSLEKALDRLAAEISVELHFQPFELNPAMAPEGEDIGEHLARKYGASAEQSAQTREMIRARGAELGFTFDMIQRSRIYNTFNAHRLMHWAAIHGRERALALALFESYFTQGHNPGSYEVLTGLAEESGLDPVEAANVLATGLYGPQVRERQQFYQRQGVTAVPAVIINERHLISGGQPPEVFEQALRQIAGAG